jgi:hypothetical protein
VDCQVARQSGRHTLRSWSAGLPLEAEQRAIVRDQRDVSFRVSAVDREDYDGTDSTGDLPSWSMPT